MKKIQKYRKLILRGCLLSVLMINATSCTKDLLEPTVITSISDASAFETPERIVAQINGLYASIKAGAFYGGRLIIYNELRADEFIMNKPNLVTGQSTWSQNVTSSTSEVQGLWSAGYNTINKVNTFLAGLEVNKGKISTALYANYTGEAKYVRALCYFALVQTYAQPYAKDAGASPGLPLRLLAENTSANNQLARSTVAQIYTQILSDLTDAEATKFWPLYSQYQQELTAVRILKRLNNSTSSTNGTEQIDKEIYYESQLVGIRKRYRDSFSKILPPEKVSILYKSEQEFNDELIKQLSERSERAGN